MSVSTAGVLKGAGVWVRSWYVHDRTGWSIVMRTFHADPSYCFSISAIFLLNNRLTLLLTLTLTLLIWLRNYADICKEYKKSKHKFIWFFHSEVENLSNKIYTTLQKPLKLFQFQFFLFCYKKHETDNTMKWGHKAESEKLDDFSK